MTNIYKETLTKEERNIMISLLTKITKYDDSPLHSTFRETKVLTPEYDIILQDISNITKRKKEMRSLIEVLKD